MSPVETVTTLLEALESGRLDMAACYLSDDFTFNGPTPRPLDKGLFLEYAESLRRAFPDLAFNAREFREQGSTVWLTLQLTGTHMGELLLPVPGMPSAPPTGKRLSLPEEPARSTVQDGQVLSITVQPVQGGGVLGILRQLGVRLPVRTV